MILKDFCFFRQLLLFSTLLIMETTRSALLVTGKPSPQLYKLVKRLSLKWDMVFLDPSTLLESILTSSIQDDIYTEVSEMKGLRGYSLNSHLCQIDKGTITDGSNGS